MFREITCDTVQIVDKLSFSSKPLSAPAAGAAAELEKLRYINNLGKPEL